MLFCGRNHHCQIYSFENEENLKLNLFFLTECHKNYVCVCSVVSDCLQPMDCSPPGSAVHGIFLARMLE